jgi:hypothetical protein
MAILTVAREFASGGAEIGQSVAQRIGYDYLDRTRILEDMKAAGGRWEKLGEDFDERSPNVWERYDWSFLGFVALSQSIMLEHALKDNVVIMGRGANFLLKGISHVLSIRVVAPLELRVERVVKREDIDRDTARWLVEKADGERSRALHFIYGKQWADPLEYDMVFNVGIQSEEDIISTVQKALVEKDKHQNRALLEQRVVAAKVKARIATNPKCLVTTLEVEPVKGELVLRGVIHSLEERKRIEEEAKAQAGDMPVRCELHYRGFLRS